MDEHGDCAKGMCTVMCCCISCIIMFISIGVIPVATFPYCDSLYFGTEEPISLILPDLRNLSLLEIKSLQEGKYKISSEYYLKRTVDYTGVISLCVLKRDFTRVSACFEIGTDVEQVVICGPDMRPDCLPGSIVAHYFGASLWLRNESTVVYSIVDIDSSEMSKRNLTNTTTTLLAVWNDVLGQRCQDIVNLTIAMIFFGILMTICCLFLCLECTLLCFGDSCNCPCCEQKW